MTFLSQVRFAIASLLSGISYLVAGALRPDSRPLLYTASLLSFSVAPYTMVMCKWQILNEQDNYPADDPSPSVAY